MADTITGTLKMLNLDTLDIIVKPIGSYVQSKTFNSSLYISGQLPMQKNSNGEINVYEGKIGENLSIEQGKEAVKLCILNVVNHLIHAVDDAKDRIKSCIKLEIFLNCSTNFADHAIIADHASNCLNEIIGDKAKHSRVTLGVSSLPLNAAALISAIFEI